MCGAMCAVVTYLYVCVLEICLLPCAIPALGVEDYLLEDIKATERGEVEACCTDMLKRWLRGERATGGKECSWSTVLGAVQKCIGREAASCIAGALQSAQ